MSKFAFIVFIATISATFGCGGGVVTAAQPKSFTKFLNNMDRSICRSFNATCKTRAKPRAKLRAVKREMPIETPATEVKSEASAAKPASVPPIPVQKPALEPKLAASAPVKTASTPPIPADKPVLEPVVVASASQKPASAPPTPVQKPEISPETVVSAPIPRAKPQKLQKQAILLPRVLPKDTSPSDDNDTCLQKLRAAGVEFTVPATNVDSGQCHVENPVNVHVVSAQGNSIELPEGPLLNCRFALQFSKWLKESGAPILAAQLRSPLKKIATGPGYECRGRNGDNSAKISEHGFGNAVDIATLRMANGKVLNVEDAIHTDGADSAAWQGFRTSACGYFTTVLGPGSNAAHEKHFHFDLGKHGSSGNYRICE